MQIRGLEQRNNAKMAAVVLGQSVRPCAARACQCMSGANEWGLKLRLGTPTPGLTLLRSLWVGGSRCPAGSHSRVTGLALAHDQSEASKR